MTTCAPPPAATIGVSDDVIGRYAVPIQCYQQHLVVLTSNADYGLVRAGGGRRPGQSVVGDRHAGRAVTERLQDVGAVSGCVESRPAVHLQTGQGGGLYKLNGF